MVDYSMRKNASASSIQNWNLIFLKHFFDNNDTK